MGHWGLLTMASGAPLSSLSSPQLRCLTSFLQTKAGLGWVGTHIEGKFQSSSQEVVL